MPTRKAPTKSEFVKEYRYTIIIEPAEGGGYIVTVPALDHIVTQGETLAEAREMAKDLIKGYLESLIKDGEPIPAEKGLREEKITVALAA